MCPSVGVVGIGSYSNNKIVLSAGSWGPMGTIIHADGVTLATVYLKWCLSVGDVIVLTTTAVERSLKGFKSVAGCGSTKLWDILSNVITSDLSSG